MEREGSREPGLPDLAALDPGRGGPEYWRRLEGRILTRAEPELARRRLRSSVPGLVRAWGRAVAPAALAAAAAALLLLRWVGSAPGPEPLLVEDLFPPEERELFAGFGEAGAPDAAAVLAVAETY